MKKKKIHTVIGKSIVRCTGGRFLGVKKNQPGRGGGGETNSQGKGKFIEKRTIFMQSLITLVSLHVETAK